MSVNFWDDFQLFLDEKIPRIVIDILISTGYDSAFSLADINSEQVDEIEQFANQKLKSMLNDSELYSRSDVFSFLPGHRKLIIALGKQVQNYILFRKETTKEFDLSHASTIMKELITSLDKNANVAPSRLRYSEIIQWFSIYIYIHSGRAAYEILSSNLPLPHVGTICKSYSNLN